MSQGLPLILLRDPSRSALAHDQRTRGYSGSDSSPGRVGVADARLVELCWPLGATFFFFFAPATSKPSRVVMSDRKVQGAAQFPQSIPISIRET